MLAGFFLLCPCGFLHCEPGKGANALCWRGGRLGAKPRARGSAEPLWGWIGTQGSQRTWRGSKVKGGRVGGAKHIPKDTARKEDRVGEVNFFRASTKPQTCGTSPGAAVAWDGWKSRWPW